MSTYSTCDYCAKLRKVDPAGRIVRHFTRIPQRVRSTSRTRQVRPRHSCMDSTCQPGA